MRYQFHSIFQVYDNLLAVLINKIFFRATQVVQEDIAQFSYPLLLHPLVHMQGIVATGATQPVDVLKTRMMNARAGEYASIWSCVLHTAKTGPLGFFKVSDSFS